MSIVESRLTSTFAMQPLLPRQLLLNRELKLDNGTFVRLYVTVEYFYMFIHILL